MTVSKEVHLIQRPIGPLKPEDFAIVETRVPDPSDGQVLIQNIYISVDPSQRPRMDGEQKLNIAPTGRAVGKIVQSKHPDFAIGDLVSHLMGYREFCISNGPNLTRINLEPDFSLTVYMHALAMTGFAAYTGLLHVGKLKEGEQVFVSSAAGSVGSFASQIAKIKNCYVVGSTGSDEKVAWLKNDLRLDKVINYKSQPIIQSLKEATPNGIDVYFDNVGGEHLEAAIDRMNPLGRIPICGFISSYDNLEKSPVYNLVKTIYSRVTIRGFVAPEFMHVHDEFQRDMKSWLRDGSMQYRETIMHGIESTPSALIGMMAGKNIGKMLVKMEDYSIGKMFVKLAD